MKKAENQIGTGQKIFNICENSDLNDVMNEGNTIYNMNDKKQNYDILDSS